MAGYTYICKEDIPQIIETQCIDFSYDSFAGLSSKHLCGRDMIDFLNGMPFEIHNKLNPTLQREIKVYTANDIQMDSVNCMVVDGSNVCWNKPGAIARPFNFMDNKCKAIDGEIWCLDKIKSLYYGNSCVRYLMEWICLDQVEMTWNYGGCFEIGGQNFCGKDSFRVAAQKCVTIDGESVCPNATGSARTHTH